MRRRIRIGLFILTAILIIFSLVCAAPVNIETAKQVANNWYLERSEENNRESVEIIETFFTHENLQDIYYVFNFREGGYIMIAADNAVIPVLGYNFEHHYGLENHPPQFDAMLASFKEQIVYAKENNLSASKETQDEWERLNVRTEDFERNRDFSRLGPLISSLWNQGYSWNTYCPTDASGPGGYVYAGCTAVAMAQVMNYWEHPTTGTGSHSYSCPPYGTLSANFGATTYNFPMNYSSPTNDSRELLYHCGVGVEMDYGPSGSGAWVGLYSPSALTAFETYFKYDTSAYFALKSGYSDTVWEGMIRTDLDNGRPLVYRGYYPYYPYAGHAFNLDGYEDSDISHFHFNWGWSGSYNGYYYLSSLNPGSHNFTDDQGAIFSLYPIGSAPGVPTNPDPADISTNISINTMISWVNGAYTVDVDVYFSSNQTLVTDKDASVRIYSSTAISTLDPSGAGSLDYNTTYYWRVVCKNSTKAETDGPVWSFTTESAGGTEVTLSYYPDITYYFSVPDGNGISKFGVYFTPADSCNLTKITAYFYGTLGTPTSCDLRIYDALVDPGNGKEYPNNLLHTENIPIASIPPGPGFYAPEIILSSPIHFDSGENFFIIYEIVGVNPSDVVYLLRSGGTTGGAEGTHSIAEYNGSWSFHDDLWGTPFEMVMDAVVEYAAVIPPNLVITPASIDFQRTAIGGWKTETVTLQNTGGGQVVVNSVSIAGDPQIQLYDYNTYPDTLFSGESINFMVAYGPDAVGTNNATITVSETSSRADHFIPINGEGYNHNSWASGSPVFDQPPTGNQGDYGWSMVTSDSATIYFHAENFWSIPEPITAIEFWGINWYYDSGWHQSDVEDPMTFEIKFYEDHATEYSPAAEVASFSIPLSRTTVDTVTFSGGPVYKYRAEFPTSVTLADGWVSIRGTSVSSPIDPWFLWSQSPIGDHANVTYDYDNSEWDFYEIDLAFALYTDVPPPPADVIVTISGTNAIVSWTPESGMNYKVYSDSDPYGSFSTLAGTVTDGSGTFTDPLGTNEKKFYRVTTVTHLIRKSQKVAPALYKSKFIRSIKNSILMNDHELKK